MWTVVEDIRVMSGMVELTIFTGLLYWFFTSSRVADMLEVMSERVVGWCGAGGRDDATGASSLRRLALQQRRRHRDIYAKIDTERASRAAALYRAKESSVVPAPAPPVRPPAGLACARCAPLSRESWQGADAGSSGKFRDASVINILDIGRQTYANGGVVSRYLCDLAQCCNLQSFKYPDVVPEVVKDEQFQRAIEDTAQAELQGSGEGRKYASVKKAVEARAMKILIDISSAMSNTVLKVVAWLCHKAVRRVAGGGCGTRAVSVERLRRAAAAGLPLVFVPLHRSHLDYILVTFTLYLSGIRPPLVAAGDNLRIPLFGWFLRGCGAFYIRRRTDGSESHDDPIYKSALRAYILSSLAEKNNLEFFIEGGRTRTGKPQLPKAGILSVIMDAYLDGTIEDALLVPVTLNYDKLVDGNFVREQLGMPKQMETFWSALKGIWHMMNTNHGTIRVDFNQPFSLKELAQSFKKYSYLRSPAGPGATLSPPNNNLAASLDRRILFNHSNSSLYGADVSDDHKVMVEAIGRHLVYDAASSSAIMCTDMVAYVLLCEQRQGCSLQELCRSVEARGRELGASGRDLGYSGDTLDVVCRALEMLGAGLVRRETAEGSVMVRPTLTVASALELSYYANTLSAHYAPSAIVATALESIVSAGRGDGVVRHSELMEASLQLCEMLSEEFLLCAPCQRIEQLVAETVDQLVSRDVLCRAEAAGGIEEERWSRRFAKTLDCDEDEEYESERTEQIKYTLGTEPHALAERRRLLLTLRPLMEAYAATGRHLAHLAAAAGAGPQKALIKATLDGLLASFADCTMPYGEAVSTDAIRNCLRVFKQWGAIELCTERKERLVRILPPYDNEQAMDSACANINKFNVDSPLLRAA